MFMISELMLVSEFSGPLFDLARIAFCFMLQLCLWKNIWTCQQIHTRKYVSDSMLTLRFLFLSSSMTCGRGKRGACVCVCVCFFCLYVCVWYLSVCMHVCGMYKILVDTLVDNTSCASPATKKKSALHEVAGKKAKMFIVWTSYQKAWHIPLGKKSKVSQLSNIFCTELLHLTELYLWLYEFGLA